MSVVVMLRNRLNAIRDLIASSQPVETYAAPFSMTPMNRAHVDCDFFFLATLPDVHHVHERIDEITRFLDDTTRGNYGSRAVYTEREKIRDLPMSSIVRSALESTHTDWSQDPVRFAALVGIFYERIHQVKLVCK